MSLGDDRVLALAVIAVIKIENNPVVGPVKFMCPCRI
jgi:hypothetical protein